MGSHAPNLDLTLARQLDAFTLQHGLVQLEGRGEPKGAVPVIRVLLGQQEGPGGSRKERELQDQATARSIVNAAGQFKNCFSGAKVCQLGEEGAAVQIAYKKNSTRARELGEAWVNEGFEVQGVKYTAMYDLGTRAPGTRKVVVTGLPPNYGFEGVIEVLLQASGYAAGPSMVVETFLGAMSIGGVPQELPRFDIIVSFVLAPPEDPMLRELPTGFKTLDGQQVWVQVEGRNLGEEFGFEPDPWQVGEADVRRAGGGRGAHPLGPMPTPPPPHQPHSSSSSSSSSPLHPLAIQAGLGRGLPPGMVSSSGRGLGAHSPFRPLSHSSNSSSSTPHPLAVGWARSALLGKRLPPGMALTGGRGLGMQAAISGCCNSSSSSSPSLLTWGRAC